MSRARFCVLVVDDHDVVHWGLRSLLSSQPWVERCLTSRLCSSIDTERLREKRSAALG